MRIRWTLRKKILIGYGINLGLMLVALLWAMGNLLMFEGAVDSLTGPNYRSVVAADNLIESLSRQDNSMLTFQLGYERSGFDTFRSAESAFLQWLGRAKESVNLDGEAALIDSIERDYTGYLGEFSRLQDARSESSYLAGDVYMRTIRPLVERLRLESLELRDMNQNALMSENSRSRSMLGRSIISTTVIGIVLIVIGLSFSFFLTNVMVEPLKELMSATKAVSEGNYHVVVHANSDDELGTLTDEFNTMVEKLRAFNDMNIEQIVSEKHKNDAILRSIEDGIIVVSSEYRIMNINLAAGSILKVDPDLVRGRHLLEVIGNGDLFDRIRNSMETGSVLEPVTGRNILTVPSEGMRRHYLFSMAPVGSGSETVFGVVLLFKDITRLKELDELKNEFVMTASHELRTPLTSVEMGVKLIQERLEGKLGEGDRDILSAVQEEVLRLKSLVNDLLDLSRIEAGRLEFRPETVHLPELCGKAVDGLLPQAKERGIRLRCSVKHGSLPAVRADPDKVGWILVNLIGNALRYTARGGGVEVSAEAAGSFVRVSVADTGAGIPYEYQSKIFEKFVRVTDGKERQGGTGLGLSICKELVHAHGGAIWVDSVPGEGSTFTFSLPVS